ncbi:hypothetical protein OV320_7872 [Actinobacteria bacterium OV320]|nr:hypothetical protein OV320_7872 [Actinobacteria bacterium OV320]
MNQFQAHITVTTQDIYETRPDIDKAVIAHIEEWRDSVDIGTAVTLDKMMNCNPECGCLADSTLIKCKGPRKGLAVEIVLDHIFSRQSVSGVRGNNEKTPFLIERTA